MGSRPTTDIRAWTAIAPLLAIGLVPPGCVNPGDDPPDGPGPEARAARFDFDGDRRADQALFTDADGGLLAFLSGDDQTWNAGEDLGWTVDPDRLPAVEDYDGDGLADPAWYEPATGEWRVFLSGSGHGEWTPPTPIGEEGDWPVPGDFDGDGAAEPALFRIATGHIAVLEGDELVEFEHDGAAVGMSDWLPAVADYDGDGLADYSWYVPHTQMWRVYESSNGHAERERVELGTALSLPVPADFDGDGHADQAVFDRGTGEVTVLRSTDGQPQTLLVDDSTVGQPHFVPAVADYDGDGLADYSWFIPASQKWRVYESGNGFAERERLQIGAPQDLPVQAPISLLPRGTVVVEIGESEGVGATSGIRGVGIDVDSLDQPHVIGERREAGMDAYHRLDGVWSGEEPFLVPPGASGSPNLEIDARDRAWISYTSFISGDTVNTGEWVALMEDVATAPSLSWEAMVPPYVGFSGYLSIDPGEPDACWRMGGQPAPTWRFDADGTPFQDITLSPGISSETIGFEIAPVKAGAEPGVWHAAHSVIYQSVRSGYVNSAMEAAIIWDDHLDVISVDSDYTRAYIGLDRRDPEVAYINTFHDGLVINIWDGEQLVFPSNEVYLLDPAPAAFGNGSERFGAQWTPAARAGAWLCWTGSDGWIHLKWFSYEGEASFGETLTVVQGQQCAMATDHRGHLQMAYVDGTMRYLRIRTR